jgi:nucleoside-diphosphate-sugar epimerase
MSKCVVTGGAGFIGSALVRKLLHENGEVAVIDNLLTGRESNLEEVRSRIVFHRIDIRDHAALVPAMQSAELVFHLAAIPSVPRSIDDPVPSHEANIDGTFNVQKLLGEYYASVFHSCFGLETVALRFFNVYGPRQDPSSAYSGVLSLFMKHILARTSPTIFGDGEQSRDFTFVEDVADLCIKAATAPGAAGKMYNAGNGGRYTLNFIWDALQKMEGVAIPASYGPPRAGDVRHSLADTTAAVAGLGHAPQFTFEQGLKTTLEWYRGASAPQHEMTTRHE